MSEHSAIATEWDIAPETVQRLWPLIDVYGRIRRAGVSVPALGRPAPQLVGAGAGSAA
jgi:hypothetical protein